jgi:hypothetical protein
VGGRRRSISRGRGSSWVLGFGNRGGPAAVLGGGRGNGGQAWLALAATLGRMARWRWVLGTGVVAEGVSIHATSR